MNEATSTLFFNPSLLTKCWFLVKYFFADFVLTRAISLPSLGIDFDQQIVLLCL